MSGAEKPVAIESEKRSDTDVMKEQEAKLRSKYPGIRPGGSSLLQKRLSKGAPKYFDSGDYNMAKAKVTKGKPVPVSQKLIMADGGVTGDAIPTPENVPQRKSSLHLQSKLAGGCGSPS